MSAVLEIRREVAPIPEAQANAIRLRRRKCHMGATMALDRGFLTKDAPVLDVGCRNPYIGLWYSLRRDLNWNGTYCGIDTTVPRLVIDTWEGKRRTVPDHGKKVRIAIRDLNLEPGDRLPFPPTGRDPFKYVGAAFLVDTLGSVRRECRERLLAECKRVALTVVVVGGATAAELDRWDFQVSGTHGLTGEPEDWGIWLDMSAEGWRARRSVKPATVMGFFGLLDSRGKAVFAARLGVCQKCGKPDLSGKSRFGCVHCGADNSVRRKA